MDENSIPDKRGGRTQRRRIPTREGAISRSWEWLRRALPLEGTSLMTGGFKPAVEFKECSDGITLRLDLPGITRLEITNWGTQLTIAGQREATPSVPTDVYYAREVSYGPFTRTFSLPSWALDHVELRAEFLQGVLILNLRKGGPESA